MKEAALVFTYA